MRFHGSAGGKRGRQIKTRRLALFSTDDLVFGRKKTEPSTEGGTTGLQRDRGPAASCQA